jgi:uncharacterized membrane protein
MSHERSDKMIAMLDLILSVIVLIVFLGMFVRLGQIRDILSSAASHQGAIPVGETGNKSSSEAVSEYEKYNPRWGKNR